MYLYVHRLAILRSPLPTRHARSVYRAPYRRTSTRTDPRARDPLARRRYDPVARNLGTYCETG